MKSFNVKVLNVVPGGLRTANIDHLQFGSGTKIPEYADVRHSVQQYLDSINGRQSGDPAKAAVVIVDVVRGEGVASGRAWNGTLFLGSDAARDVKAKCEATLKTLQDWGDVITSIDIDA